MFEKAAALATRVAESIIGRREEEAPREIRLVWQRGRRGEGGREARATITTTGTTTTTLVIIIIINNARRGDVGPTQQPRGRPPLLIL